MVIFWLLNLLTRMISLLETLQWLPSMFRIKIWIKCLPCCRDLLVLLPLPSIFVSHHPRGSLCCCHTGLSIGHALPLFSMAFVSAVTSAWSALSGIFSSFRPLLKCYPLTNTFSLPPPPPPPTNQSFLYHYFYFIPFITLSTIAHIYVFLYIICIYHSKKKASWG